MAAIHLLCAAMAKILLTNQIAPFPPLGIFLRLATAGQLVFCTHTPYIKQSIWNGYQVQGSNGPIRLSIPIKGSTWGKPLASVMIDNNGRWQTEHFKTLQSCYARSPFWDYYAHNLQHLLAQDYSHLWHFALASMTFCLSTLQKSINVPTCRVLALEEPLDQENLHIIGHKKELDFSIPQDLDYDGVFGKKFDTQVSVLDALFCEGPTFLAKFVAQH